MSGLPPAVRWSPPLLTVLLLSLLISPLALRAQGPTPAPFIEQWISSLSGRSPTITWSDIDNDTDSDIILGIEFDSDIESDEGGGVAIYLNDQRSLPNYPVWYSPDEENVSDLALVDVNGDTLKDITFADSQQESRIYRNVTEGSNVRFELATLATPLPSATVIAWGDVDNDGDADLFLGGEGGGEVYRNDGQDAGALLLTSVYLSATLDVRDAVWADVNSDSFDDLALATDNQGLVMLRNDTVRGAGIAFSDIAPTAFYLGRSTSGARSIVAADYIGGTEPDLIVGHRSTIEFFTNSGGNFSFVRGTPGNGATALAMGDYDGDNLLDLALGNSLKAEVLRNNGGGNFASTWSGPSASITGLDWNDYDGDNDLDLAIGNFNEPSTVYRNTRNEVNSEVQVKLEGQNAGGALIYRLRSDGGELFSPYTDAAGNVARTDGDGKIRVGIDIAPGDELVALVPNFNYRSYMSTNVPVTITSAEATVVTSTLTITDSGRLRRMNVMVNGSHEFSGDLNITLISPSGRRVILAERGCSGSGEFSFTFTDEATSTECPATGGNGILPVESLSRFLGQSIAGTWTLEVEDIGAPDGGLITSWGLNIDTTPYRRYATSATPTADGIQAYTVQGGGLQTLNVSATNNLLLFDLSVSLEWDARNDGAYLRQLEFDLKRAAELLYDYTDGQATLGNITVYHDRKRWRTADIRVYATNRLRPNAQKGGISDQVIYDPDTEEVAYSPGEIRIGAVWNRFGNATGTVGADWPQAVAHELGHYLFYLEDNYLGLDANDQLIKVDGCPGAMSDPHREDYSEFSPLPGWLPFCERTLSNLFTARSDWQTIQKFYPDLKAPTVYDSNPGPSYLPLDVVKVTFDEPTDPALTFASPLFDIVNREGGRVIPGESARAFLFHQNQIVDLGRPVIDKIEARGAQPGDRLCLYEPDAQRLGCIEQINSVTDKLTLYPIAGSYPFDIKITPVATNTIAIEMFIPDASPELAVALSFYQPELGAVRRVNATVGQVTGRYTATLTAAGPIDTGFLHVQVADEAAQPRELVIDYSQLGRYSLAPDTSRTTFQNRPCVLPTPPGCKTSPAPTASADGQAFLYGRVVNYLAGNYYSLQGQQLVPDAPAWRLPVGRPYRFVSSPGAITLSGISINIGYLEQEVPYGAEGGIGIYFQPASGGNWRLLPSTRFDPTRNEVAAKLAGDGTYLLMTTLPLRNGWNNISFPWQEPTPIRTALDRLGAAYYTAIYGYNGNDTADPWKVFDPAAPPYVNDLTTMEYGQGYWIAIEGLPNATQAARTSTTVPVPPATYYGQLLASGTFSPTVGMKVQALIGEKVCGEATTLTYQDRIVFSITVPADDGAIYSGCGLAGRTITLTANGTTLPYNLVWTNDRPREVRLTRLPMIFR
jgi:subtilisin-like proprotein convertase family protein